MTVSTLMVAAYNAGRGTVQQWIAGQIWDVILNVGIYPFEEQEYVRNVLKNYEAYQVTPSPDKITVKEYTQLRQIQCPQEHLRAGAFFVYLSYGKWRF